jgi:hypothetical protein
MKNDGRCAGALIARPAFFRGVEPEARRNTRPRRRDSGVGDRAVGDRAV